MQRFNLDFCYSSLFITYFVVDQNKFLANLIHLHSFLLDKVLLLLLAQTSYYASSLD